MFGEGGIFLPGQPMQFELAVSFEVLVTVLFEHSFDDLDVLVSRDFFQVVGYQIFAPECVE